MLPCPACNPGIAVNVSGTLHHALASSEAKLYGSGFLANNEMLLKVLQSGKAFSNQLQTVLLSHEIS